MHYMVARHRFAVSGETEVFALMVNYESFGCDGGETVFTLTVESGGMPEFTEELQQDDDGQVIVSRFYP